MRLAVSAATALSGAALMGLAIYGQPAAYVHDARERWVEWVQPPRRPASPPATPQDDTLAIRMAALQQEISTLRARLAERPPAGANTSLPAAPTATEPVRTEHQGAPPQASGVQAPGVQASGVPAARAIPKPPTPVAEASPPATMVVAPPVVTPVTPTGAAVQPPPPAVAENPPRQAVAANPPAIVAAPAQVAPPVGQSPPAPAEAAISAAPKLADQSPPAASVAPPDAVPVPQWPDSPSPPPRRRERASRSQPERNPDESHASAHDKVASNRPPPAASHHEQDDSESVLSRLRQEPSPAPAERSSPALPRLGAARSALATGRTDNAVRLLQEAQLQLVFRPVEAPGGDQEAAGQAASDVARALEALSANNVSASRRFIDQATNDLRGIRTNAPISYTGPQSGGYAPAYPSR